VQFTAIVARGSCGVDVRDSAGKWPMFAVGLSLRLSRDPPMRRAVEKKNQRRGIARPPPTYPSTCFAPRKYDFPGCNPIRDQPGGFVTEGEKTNPKGPPRATRATTKKKVDFLFRIA